MGRATSNTSFAALISTFGGTCTAEMCPIMRIATLPGVFRPISDTWLLARALSEQARLPRGSVLDLCTGSGVLAVCAARQGARKVTAVDISRLAVMNARINARLNGVTVTALRSDLFSALGGERYDVIVCNPPYVPSESHDLPSRGLRRAWEAGLDGRALLDRVIAESPQHLFAGGTLLVVHSDVCGDEATRNAMTAGGLTAQVINRQDGPLGPLMRSRVDDLQSRGVLRVGRSEEQVLVIAGRRNSGG